MTGGGENDGTRWRPGTAFDAKIHSRSIDWWLVDFMRERGATLGELSYIYGLPLDELRERYLSNEDGTRYLRWIRGQQCCIYGCNQLGEAHHALPRGAGGKDWQTVPLCHDHHMELHNIGWNTFEDKHHVSLHQIAAVLHEAWHKPKPPPD